MRKRKEVNNMASQNFQFIMEAIKNKQQIYAEFDGNPRKMCPHVLGYSNGIEQALFCQFGGRSTSEGEIRPDNAKWRCIPVQKLLNVRIVNGPWYTLETKHKRRTSCVDKIIAEVPFP